MASSTHRNSTDDQTPRETGKGESIASSFAPAISQAQAGLRKRRSGTILPLNGEAGQRYRPEKRRRPHFSALQQLRNPGGPSPSDSPTTSVASESQTSVPSLCITSGIHTVNQTTNENRAKLLGHIAVRTQVPMCTCNLCGWAAHVNSLAAGNIFHVPLSGARQPPRYTKA